MAAVAAVAVVAAIVASLASSQAADTQAPARLLGTALQSKRLTGRPVAVQVTATPLPAPAVPSGFLGLSFESADLPTIANDASNGDLVTYLRALGPGVMRFGGYSADHTAAWVGDAVTPIGSTGPIGPPTTDPPSWASTTITQSDLDAIAQLAQATGWRVLFTVNLGHYDPETAAAEAQAASNTLGSSLAGIAIGNEPDHFVKDILRPFGWQPTNYLTELGAYQAAIAAAVPGVPIVGPDISSGTTVTPWLATGSGQTPPSLLTVHYYPLSSCGGIPKISELVSTGIRTLETNALDQFVGLAHTNNLPLRIDETNNISCSGQPGVSNTFASALWAIDYITRAMQDGIGGINFHDLITEPAAYGPLVVTAGQTLTSGSFHANPEWYALLLASDLVGDQPVDSQVSVSDPGLTSAAFLSSTGELHIVLVNFDPPGTKRILVKLHAPSQYTAGSIERLTAPAPTAVQHVKLGGQSVNGSGVLVLGPHLPRVGGKPGALKLVMPPDSAALITLSAPAG